jgi:hypothetical protein
MRTVVTHHAVPLLQRRADSDRGALMPHREVDRAAKDTARIKLRDPLLEETDGGERFE